MAEQRSGCVSTIYCSTVEAYPKVTVEPALPPAVNKPMYFIIINKNNYSLMLDSAISLADHSESQKELCILEWKQISLLGLAYHLIIQLPIGPVSYNTA